MMTEDEESIEVSVGPAKFSAKGRGLARISESIADLISPFSQGFGLAGDHIRMYRQRSVEEALRRATKMAADRGDEIRPVNPKNLVPLIEALSLEGEEENELSDLWSRLLLSGDSEFDAPLAMFTDSLKRMGPKEAHLLKNVCMNSSIFPRIFPDDVRSNGNIKRIEILYKSRQSILTEDQFSNFVNRMFLPKDFLYATPLMIDEDIDDAEANREAVNGYYEDFDSYSILEREGFVTLKRIEVPFGAQTASVMYAEATRIGLEFIRRCYPEASKEED